MRIAVVGAGGVGGYFGGRLAAAGVDVSFLARGRQLAALREGGLHIESDLGNADVTVQAYDDPAAIGTVDLVIIAVKLWDLDDVVRGITPLVSSQTAILSLQNGVVKDAVLRDAFGVARTIGGLCYVGATVARPGVIKQTGAMQRIVVGEFDGRSSARIATFAELCRRAAIDVVISSDIERAIWEKFVFLVGLEWSDRGDSAAYWSHSLELPRPRVPRVTFAETVSVGRALGIAFAQDFVADRLAFCDTLYPEFTSSMHVDLEHANRLEVPWLQGVVSHFGRAASIATPANDFVADVLAVYADGAPAPATT